ncbi:bestrophin-like domain [Massilia horti]|nr:hypothetical protein [Massilia horti]
MRGSEPLDFLPLWGLFITILVLLLISVEAGYQIGKFRGSRVQEHETPVGEMVGTILGLLAFILAFTFGLAATRYDTRRQLVVDEANSIEATYLRAGMLPGQREEIRALLREYVDIRLATVRSGKIAEGIRKAEDVQKELWEQTVPLAEKNPNSIVVGLFVQSLNEVIDMRGKRVAAGVRNRIPLAIWVALYGVAVLSFAALGYHSGLILTSRSPAILAVVITFSVVLGLIADLDRPQEGTLKVSQQPLVELRQWMNTLN